MGDTNGGMQERRFRYVPAMQQTSAGVMYCIYAGNKCLNVCTSGMQHKKLGNQEHTRLGFCLGSRVQGNRGIARAGFFSFSRVLCDVAMEHQLRVSLTTTSCRSSLLCLLLVPRFMWMFASSQTVSRVGT